MPYVQYWAIGNHNEASLSWTQAEISSALVADWLPALPFSASRSVLGWPHHLIRVQGGLVHPYLALESFAGYCERQWKGVLSWMLGIAGTRTGSEGQVLQYHISKRYELKNLFLNIGKYF